MGWKYSHPKFLTFCVYFMSNDIATNSCTNLFCTNWCGMIKLVELNISWLTWFIYIILYFHSTNLIMPHQFVQNKSVQEFVAISLLIFKYFWLQCLQDECLFPCLQLGVRFVNWNMKEAIGWSLCPVATNITMNALKRG